ncbi:MAG: hypothetical protein R3321_10175 [Nitrososphaeraceae archaeon]|nr:hypothetical protein [Nitrososphaeraceae archaeon]
MKLLLSKFIIFHFLFIVVLSYSNQCFTFVTVYSQEDNKKGFGIQERERARIHTENNSQIVKNDLSGLILIGTIIAIIGVSSYALYKIYLIRRKSNKSKVKK